jgi:hypothetical protein
MVAVAGAAGKSTPVTFNKDVLPILQKNCQGCHRPGEAPPMSFLTYQETRPWAKSIREAVLEKRMPPWFADPHFGKFTNDRSLSQSDINTLVAWVDGGAREGNPSHAPKPLEFTDGWSIGKPDAVLEMPNEFTLPASGTVNYQFILLPTEFKEDKWVEKVEIRPSNRAVVHHIVSFITEPGSRITNGLKPGQPFPVPNSAPRGNPVDDGTGFVIVDPEILSVYVPGTSGQSYKPGHAKLIKAGSSVLLQMHYTTNGVTTADRSRIGFVFAKETPSQRVRSFAVANQRFKIPPGAPNHRVDARVTLEESIAISSFAPHMHARGKRFEFRAVSPSGESEILMRVPKYDFNWQLFYYLDKPVVLPKGTRLEVTAYFDNSVANPGNPDPGAEVRWGDQSWEEMVAGFFDITVDPSVDPKSPFIKKKPPSSSN